MAMRWNRHELRTLLSILGPPIEAPAHGTSSTPPLCDDTLSVQLVYIEPFRR
jgi:hypothetical protein